MRVDGVNEDHVAMLADLDEELPPILVHRGSMVVIDGVHRVRAALARGDGRIQAVYSGGDDVDALILAVRLNTRHGLPLSRRDRQAAVLRLIAVCPDWSDRRIAAAAGVSHMTVGAVRRRSTGEIVQSNVRIGKDGRARMRDPSAARAQAAAMLADRPNASLREVARSVGLSPATVLDVRRRRARGTDEPSPGPAVGLPDPAPSPATIREATVQRLAALRRDPSLRYSLAGRTLIGLLSTLLGLGAPEDLATAVPAYARPVVADLVRQSAGIWLRIAEQLETAPDRQVGTTS